MNALAWALALGVALLWWRSRESRDYLRGTEERWDAEAEATRERAVQGDAKAQAALGNLYFGGQGVAQDYAEAVKWYRKAAEQGFSPAQYGLGLAYDRGEGVAQDYVEAVKWYRKAAELGMMGPP